jgi:site-specific DNA-methyltransferase (adenine-specific)
MIKIHNGDYIKLSKKIKSESVDCVICDPPYFLSNDGMTCVSGKMVSVNKGDWDKMIGFNEKFEFNLKWITEAYRILKHGGTMWVSGTQHNIYIVGSILQSMGDFKILNNITWVKKSPPPNLSCRVFTHSTETILWVRKGMKASHLFEYKLMKSLNDNKQMKDVWLIGRPKKEEIVFGKHPTQKPLELIERMILCSTTESALCVDFFGGSGTTMVACKKTNRNGISFEINPEFYKLSLNRIKNIK